MFQSAPSLHEALVWEVDWGMYLTEEGQRRLTWITPFNHTQSYKHTGSTPIASHLPISSEHPQECGCSLLWDLGHISRYYTLCKEYWSASIIQKYKPQKLGQRCDSGIIGLISQIGGLISLIGSLISLIGGLFGLISGLIDLISGLIGIFSGLIQDLIGLICLLSGQICLFCGLISLIHGLISLIGGLLIYSVF